MAVEPHVSVASETVLIFVFTALLLNFVSGMLGRTFRFSDSAAYRRVKPSMSPPGWVFGVVWTLAYTWMAFALTTSDNLVTKFLLAAHIALTFAWTPAFKQGLEASPQTFTTSRVILAGALGTAVAVVGSLARTHHFRTALLGVPYLAWLVFANVLNHDVERLSTL
jgi:benzodiazapine receptor